MLRGFTITNGIAEQGAGIYCDRSSPTITHCIFEDNSASYRTGRGQFKGFGGAVYCGLNTDPIIINCTFHGNSAHTNGGGVYSSDGGLTLVNCILWGNTPDEIYAATDKPLVTFSNIQGRYQGEGNIAVDPLFANPETGDLHLKSQASCWDPQSRTWVQDEVTSPCIDAGDPDSDWSAEPSPNGGRINMGAYGGTDQASQSQ